MFDTVKHILDPILTCLFEQLLAPVWHALGFVSGHLPLSALAISLGVGFCLPQIYGLKDPAGFALMARRFSRSVAAGRILMILGTLWFLYYVRAEDLADYAGFKQYLMLLFLLVGIGTCIFVQDFLAVRGLAVVWLVLAKLMVDTGRPALPHTPWVLVIQTWAYVLVAAGIWFTVSPWRLRDFLAWGTATELRIRVGCALRLAFGLFVAALGLTVFRSAA
jgi:hypothetical protein